MNLGHSWVAAALVCTTAVASFAAAPAPVTPDEALEIATNAYIYAYPLVILDLTRNLMTNVGSLGKVAVVNHFGHASAFPDAKFTAVVRPNADTLYSSLWFDVRQEPLVMHVPDSGGRYYLIQMMDAWTDTFASPGKRTTGTGEQTYAITGPGWRGTLPPGMMEIKSPTERGWILGRTQTNGKMDYESVHRFQAGITAQPLSRFGQPYIPEKGTADPSFDRTPPVRKIEKLSPAEFFTRFADLTAADPAHTNDYPIVHQLARLGIVPGQSFNIEKVAPETRKALELAPAAALMKIKAVAVTDGVHANGWRIKLSAVGTYGADYLHRASAAYAGLGVNTIEDAVYPIARTDSDGQPFAATARYKLHFSKAQLPPVRAFWSLTMYNDQQLFADNPIDRYALGDRDKLNFNADGSLDLYIQRESPGPEKESNWLPAPQSGGFTMSLRLYWPHPEVMVADWTPPGAERLKK